MITKTTLFRTLLSGALLLGGAAFAQDKVEDAQTLLERARHLETSRGELGPAADLYRRVMADSTAHPELVMQARLQLATCLLKQGDEGGARGVLTELVDNLPSRESLLEPINPDGKGGNLAATLNEISEMALEPIDKEEVTRFVMEGIAGRLGKHSEYFSPAKLEQFKIGMNNKLVGIGALLDNRGPDGHLMVKAVFPHTPAEEAKLMAGDQILAIDGRPVPELGDDLVELTSKIRGEEGTEVTLKIKEVESGVVVDLPIVRRSITLPETKSVEASLEADGVPQFMIDPALGVGAFRMRSFPHGVADIVEKRVTELLDGGMRALVIDLRGNGGGSLQESIEVSGLFVGDKLVVRTESRTAPSPSAISRW